MRQASLAGCQMCSAWQGGARLNGVLRGKSVLNQWFTVGPADLAYEGADGLGGIA